MGSSTTTIERNDPWAPAQPYLKSGLQEASQLYKQGKFKINPYPGDLVADPTQAQRESWQAIEALAPIQSGILGSLSAGAAARASSGIPAYAENAFRRAANPAYGAELQNRMRNAVIEQVLPAVNATFGASGMTGSTLHSNAVARGLASGLAPYEAQLLENQANRALDAARIGAAADIANRETGLRGLQVAGQMATGMTAPYLALDKIGQEQQKTQQAEIAAEAQRYIQQQAADMDAIARWLQLTSGLGANFATHTGTSTYNPGPLGILGAMFKILSMF